jgi:hypothetical protein
VQRLVAWTGRGGSLPRSAGHAYVIEKIFAGDFVLSQGPHALPA